MSIKAGETAVVKITGEPVFVLKLGAATQSEMYFEELGQVATLRRYKETDSFHGYVEDRLFVAELETPKERLQKDLDSFSEMVPVGRAIPVNIADTAPERSN